MAADLEQLWRTTVDRRKSAVAVIDRNAARSWTFADLNEAAEACAGESLVQAKLRRKRVLLAEANGAAWFTGFIGLLKAGAIPAPVDSNETRESLRATAEATGAAGIWSHGRLERTGPGRVVRGPDACLVKLTSGSTGVPKALMFSHAQMIADGRQVCSSMGILPDDLNLGVIPFSHSYGLGNIVVPLLVQGTAVACVSGPLPRQLAEDCRRTGATVFPTVPALLKILTVSEISARSFSSLRLVISAGAPLPAEVAHAFSGNFGVGVHGFYGSSETGGITYDRAGEATAQGRSVGEPLEGVRLEFRGRGRFSVVSPAVMGRGSFSPKDRGELNKLGELVLAGRAGRLVKIGGRRLNVGEVETALRGLRGVDEVCVLPHPERDDAIAAVVVSARKSMEIRRDLAAVLAGWKVPERIRIVDAMPLTARGKTDLRAVKRLVSGRR